MCTWGKINVLPVNSHYEPCLPAKKSINLIHGMAKSTGAKSSVHEKCWPISDLFVLNKDMTMTVVAKTPISKKLNWAQIGQAEVLSHQDCLDDKF